MKNGLSTVVLILVFLIGLSLLLYPTVSDYWNRLHQSRVIDSYAASVANIQNEEYDRLLEEARAFNAEAAARSNPFLLSDKQKEEYPNVLNITGTGVMGYLEVPSIDCYLPIYHSTNEAVLQVAIGHLEWTSLPVGGEGTHSVFSGHRGLPSAKLFTNLNKVVIGDIFMIRVLNELMTYQVDQILTVLPEDTTALQISPGEDLCTLVTCTPYGINTHRLLVRGHRIENIEASVSIYVTADAMQIEPIIVAPIVAVPLLFILVGWLLISDRLFKQK